MKRKSLLMSILLASTLLVGCGSSSTDDSNKEVSNGKPAVEDTNTDATASASFPSDDAGLEKALSADGTWIILVTGDMTTDKELVVDGQFYNKNDKSKDIYRKLALYDQDENKNVTASHILTAPKITVKSENFKIQEGTFKGDIYVEANGFTLKNTKVEGNVYFTNEEAKTSFVLDGGEVTGVTELKNVEQEPGKEVGFTGVKSTEYKTEKDVILTEITFEDGQAVDIKIDVVTDGKSKVEESKAGNYVMKEREENAWHEQIALLEAFLKENNFDLTKVTLSDDAGHTDAVAGVTIKVPDYIKAVEEALK